MCIGGRCTALSRKSIRRRHQIRARRKCKTCRASLLRPCSVLYQGEFDTAAVDSCGESLQARKRSSARILRPEFVQISMSPAASGFK